MDERRRFGQSTEHHTTTFGWSQTRSAAQGDVDAAPGTSYDKRGRRQAEVDIGFRRCRFLNSVSY